MPRRVSLNPATFYGGDTPALSGRYIIGTPYFTIYGKNEAQPEADEADGKGGGDNRKTYAVFPVTPAAGGDEIELRYSAGFANRVVPGSDPETPAEGDGNTLRGDFLVGLSDEYDEHLSEKYHMLFPKFIRSLAAAGVDPALFDEIDNKGLSVLAGSSIEFISKVEQYKDRKTGEMRDRAPFNYALAGSFQPPKGKKAGGAAKPAAKTAAGSAAKAPSAPAANGSAGAAGADASAIPALLQQAVARASDLLLAGEAVTQKDLTQLVVKLNKEQGLLSVPISIVYATQAIHGSGEFQAVFADMLAANEAEGGVPAPISVDGSGNLSIQL